VRAVKRRKTTWWQALLLAVFGLVCALLLLEAGMRAAGAVIMAVQERRNRESIMAGGTYTILCLGESTTAGTYPSLLEEELNRRAGSKHFTVINAGISGTNTSVILSLLPGNLDRYRPDMVVTMMGINDHAAEIDRLGEESAWSAFWRNLRVYKLARSLSEHIRASLSGRGTDLEELYRERDTGGEESPAAPPVSRAAARGYHRAKRYGAAIRACRELLRREPGDLGLTLLLADSCVGAGRWAEAERALAGLPEEEARGHWALVVRGRLQAARGDPAGAETCYREAVAARPDDPTAYFELARVLDALGAPERALAAARAGASLDPAAAQRYVDGLLDQAEMAIVENDYPRAERDCLRALDLLPEHGPAVELTVNLYRRQLRSADAVALCRRALAERPDDVRILNALGTSLIDLKEYGEAEEALLRAIDFDLAGPVTNIAKYGPIGLPLLTTLYLDLEEYGKLRGVCERILAGYPDNPRVLNIAATACENQGDREAAARYRARAGKTQEHKFNPMTERNYRALAEAVRGRGIRLVCVQYPCRPLGPLKEMLAGRAEVAFVDNERGFKEAIAREGVKAYFVDLFAGDFGHYTRRGGELLARAVADVIFPSAAPAAAGARRSPGGG